MIDYDNYYEYINKTDPKEAETENTYLELKEKYTILREEERVLKNKKDLLAYQLGRKFKQIRKQRGLTATAAAKIVEIGASDMTRVNQARVSGDSIRWLMHILSKLNNFKENSND